MKQNYVKPKKHLGQHFLTNEQIAHDIADIVPLNCVDLLLEIGPGTGVLTRYLYEDWGKSLTCFEVDTESTAYLSKQDWALGLDVKEQDFLQANLVELANGRSIGLIGNYPYNISTEIAFRAIESKGIVKIFGGMFQKEVAERFCAPHGSRTYGVTSVLLQAMYDCKYLFTVDKEEFNPPPKVQSGVMICKLREEPLACQYKTLRTVVKTAFGQRRKTLNNALKSLAGTGFELPEEYKPMRAEQLSVEEFISLARNWDVVKGKL
jgi:16S rRNA (adenine1518-N6/adenine1519-N6)-dimethyltransferase